VIGILDIKLLSYAENPQSLQGWICLWSYIWRRYNDTFRNLLCIRPEV